ncbi:DUF1311 domain-containing protein [Ancylobacter dichloromethanicus]|uniref:Lysozyme inhibitor LprI-like N-terminal domain-containing protein n=1 Tax=Ancylobacter dichloromethanicus TaxID=518825 RepID=A0A9W6MY45_9HYPH|nr:DUF1311 domain-containing protein [Ancylobacter dichloromethanicus]MBS7555387.1 DUF1311 domain-containing protein [Ancylobacter dichloromethanicus]GLK70570.1 hypothetical protein GCM10017643_06850 [Ancylobacter dichloromethanicus]
MTHPVRRFGPIAAALLLLCTAVPAVRAGDAAQCRRENADPRGYLDCLNLLQRTGEQALQRSVDGVEAAIEAREDLQPSQRRRWISLFRESQGRFVHWRNFECQSIAPFEGEGSRQTVGGRLGGIGVIEQRLVCLISHNERRATDLEARYAPAGGWPPLPAAAPEAAAPATGRSGAASPVVPAGVPRIIDLAP